jgi:hypothetical protein
MKKALSEQLQTLFVWGMPKFAIKRRCDTNFRNNLNFRNKEEM